MPGLRILIQHPLAGREVPSSLPFLGILRDLEIGEFRAGLKPPSAISDLLPTAIEKLMYASPSLMGTWQKTS